MLQSDERASHCIYTHTPAFKRKNKDKQSDIQPKGKRLNLLFKSGNQINSQIYNKTTCRKTHFIISQNENQKKAPLQTYSKPSTR